MESHRNQRKKAWRNRDNVMDEQLRQWVINMRVRGVYLTNGIILEKGRHLKDSLNLSRPDNERSDCKFSEERLHGFKKRHNFSCHKSHGESGYADRAGAMSALPTLRHISS